MRITALLLILLFVPSVFAQGYLGNTIFEGETKEFMVSDKIYEITLVIVSDSRQIALFKVKGELSDKLSEREKHRFSDGSQIFVSHILPNEASEFGGGDLVEFYFMATGGSLAKPQVTRNVKPAGYEDIVDLLGALTGATDASLPKTTRVFECFVDPDCDDGNGCSADGCIGGKCIHVNQNGCSYDKSVCVAVNTRMKLNDIPRFCGADGKWQGQVALKASCENNFECVSNLCSGGVCKRVDENGDLVEKPAPGEIPPPQRETQAVIIVETPKSIPSASPAVTTQGSPSPPIAQKPKPEPKPEGSFAGFFRWLISSFFG